MFYWLERVHKHISDAHTEAEWLVAEWTEKLLSLRSKPLEEPEFNDPVRALVYFSNPELGFTHSQIQEKMQKAAERVLQKGPEATIRYAFSLGFVRSRRTTAEE